MARRSMFWIEFGVALSIRLFLMQSAFKSAFQDRVEIATPLNSWKRLQEGIYLYKSGVDPYAGDMFHETPLTLFIFKWLIELLGYFTPMFFVLIDLFVGYLLYKAAMIYVQFLEKEDELQKSNAIVEESERLFIPPINVSDTPSLVLYAYLFNPYIIFNCVAQTTTGVSNLMLASILLCLVTKNKYPTTFFMSLATLQSWYPILLLVPACLQFYNHEKTKDSIVKTVLSFVICMGTLLTLCFYIAGSWSFLNSIYNVIFNAHDLTPNIGLFWYFFTEMFEHFRNLFIASLQINATVLYLLPLSLHLHKEPIFLAMILMALTAVFKSYPSLGDVGFYLSLLPLWNHLFLFMQQLFIVGCILIITSVLGPTVWHLWIYSGSANANFFFGVTLAFATAQIFLITDLLFARKKRQFAIKYGWPEDSNKRVLILD